MDGGWLRARAEDEVGGWSLPLLSCRNTDTGIQRLFSSIFNSQIWLTQIFGEEIGNRLLSPFRLFLVKTSQYIANFHPEGGFSFRPIVAHLAMRGNRTHVKS